MSQVAALKMVEAGPRFVEELELWSGGARSELHSLHYAFNYPTASPPEFAQFVIKRYSRAGDLILDPFCGSGTVALEACLAGRSAIASDLNPLAAKVALAKLEPADISEVMLKLQAVNMMRPVSSEQYRQYFAPFYDINTFRELVNLRRFCLDKDDRVSRFTSLVASSLLHGSSAGAFSVYTYPQRALSPDEQLAFNRSRGQTPDHRTIMPRILRKTAAVMRDGLPSVLRRAASRSRVQVSDARNLTHVQPGTVDLVATAPPLPGDESLCEDLWLKLWFMGVAAGSFQSRLFMGNVNEWKLFLNEVLLELARVVKPGGRTVFLLGPVKEGRRLIDGVAEVEEMVREQLPAFWHPDGLWINSPPKDAVRKVPSRESARSRDRNSLLVLRRV